MDEAISTFLYRLPEYRSTLIESESWDNSLIKCFIGCPGEISLRNCLIMTVQVRLIFTENGQMLKVETSTLRDK